MPTYHARGVSVRLGVKPLADTITPNIVLRKGDVVRKQCEEAEQQLLNSRFLNEKRVTFPGDEHSYELNWLGGAPFMQSEVGRDLFMTDGKKQSGQASSTTNLRLRQSPTKAEPYATKSDPLALSLHVITSQRTFVSGLNNSNKLHIKIEVFLNGTLSSCLFFPPYEYRSGSKDFHQVIGGHRVDFLAERPWVILPPDAAADGTQRTTPGSSSVEQRWQEIGEALRIEADHRGSNKHSELPPSAEFLKALAAMYMPDQVRNMQIPGSKKLAIIDVVITAGKGRKVTSGAAYLKAPQRFDDENFPLRNIAETSKDAETTTLADRGQAGAGDHFVSETEAESPVAVEETATGLDRHAKRRAIAIHGLPTSFSRPDQRRSQPHNAGHTPHALSIPPTVLGVPGDAHGPTMMNLPHSRNLPSELFQARNEYLSSPDRGRTAQAGIAHQTTGSLRGSSLYGTPQSFSSVPGSSLSHAHTPRTHLSPQSVQFPGSASSQHSTGAFLPSKAFQYPDLASSPYHYMQSVASSPIPQMFSHSYPLDSDRFSDHGLPEPAFPSSFQQPPRRSSIGSSQMALSSPATPQDWLGDELYSQLASHNQSADFVPNMVPSTISRSHIMGPQSDSIPMSSPFDRRFSLPLPPTGFFSVPTKPKSSMSPRKQSRSDKGETSTPGLSVRRLVIKGKKGAKIVDHTWSAKQQVPHREAQSSTVSKPSNGSNCSTSASEASEIETSESQLRHPTPRAKDVPENRDPAALVPAIAIKGEDTNGVMGDLPVGPDKIESTLPKEQPRELEVAIPAHSSSAPPEPKSEKPRTSKPPPQRRTASSQGILGIQGPKATAFIFEDPEQLLREAAKEKRTKAPRKLKISTAAGSDVKIEPPATPSADIPTVPPAVSSSPLSSIHTTPGLDGATDSHTVQAAPQTPTTTAEPALPQLDGPSDYLKPITSPTKSTTSSSPTKASPAKITPAKRKSSNSYPSLTHYLEKQPRSPDRLKTISNPPLNQDCVVALAESEDNKAKRGVLRQVRGERQGVFAEEYVVCATRFYVPGN